MSDLDPAISETFGDTTITPSPQLRSSILDAVDDAGDGPVPWYHLAQMNTARFHRPMDHPDMADFVEMLDPVNHHADSAPGFVWRLTDEDSNDATSITFYDDPLLLVNMSVWTDVSSLRNFVYRTDHSEMVKRRGEWADAMESHYIVLWWVPVGHTPDVAEGDACLRLLREKGPTPEAFTFGRSFPPPELNPLRE